MCIDFLSLERSKGGFENILVITDHFARYAQAFPTRNQTASKTAKVLSEILLSNSLKYVGDSREYPEIRLEVIGCTHGAFV